MLVSRLLYTSNIRGDLDLLPRLYTFLRELERDAPAEGRVLRVDTGNACAADRWPCDVTGGRAAYLALDAMGFTAANIQGVLDAENREKLRDQVAIGLVDDAHNHADGGLVYSLEPALLTADVALNVLLAPAMEARLDGSRLRLAPIAKTQVGVFTFYEAHPGNGTALALDSFTVHEMPAGTNPDPTIAGVIDFIRDEARYYGKRQRDKGDSTSADG